MWVFFILGGIIEFLKNEKYQYVVFVFKNKNLSRNKTGNINIKINYKM